MKTYEVTTYENTDGYGQKIFGYAFRNVKKDAYLYTNDIFENVLKFALDFADEKGEVLEEICTIW